MYRGLELGDPIDFYGRKIPLLASTSQPVPAGTSTVAPMGHDRFALLRIVSTSDTTAFSSNLPLGDVTVTLTP